MKLQKHFFFSIIVLFIGVFGISLFIESFLTEKHLQRAATFFHDFVVRQYEKENDGFAEYLNFSLQSLLKDLSLLRDHTLEPNTDHLVVASEGKGPGDKTSVLSSLHHVGRLFQEIPWINYVSFSTSGTAYAVFYPYSWQDTLFAQEKSPGIYYTVVNGKEAAEVLVGIPLEQEREDSVHQAFAFFAVRDFLRFTSSEIQEILSRLKKQKGFIFENLEHLFQYVLQEGGLGGGLEYPFHSHYAPELQEAPVAGRNVERALAANLLSLVSALQQGQVKILPRIISKTKPGFEGGVFSFRDPLWIEKKQSPENPVTLKMPKRTGSGKVGELGEKAIENAFLQIISSPHAAFIVQHLPVSQPSHLEQLSVGVSMNVFLEGVLDLQYQNALLVYQGKVFDHVGLAGQDMFPTGTQIQQESVLPGSSLQKISPHSLFYSVFYPFQKPELCVLVGDSRRDLQTLVQKITSEGRRVVQNISWDMRVIALVGLFFFALLANTLIKRITAPIILLAEETQKVGAGQLDKVTLPQFNGYDEMVALCTAFTQMVQDLQEKEKVKGVLNKVVSTEIAKEILKGNVHLGGEEQCVTVFFADIRHFTQMSQKLSPKEVIDLLNGCMTEVSQAVDGFGGVIDKYVGDGVMALFGAPVKQENSALRAILCALETIEKLASWNATRIEQGLQPVEMGFGLHYGNVLVGNMGAENRLSYTVIGNNVNLAARICGAAGGMQILITPALWEAPQVQEYIIAESVPPLSLKGYDTPVSVLRVVGVKKEFQEETKKLLQGGMEG